MTANPLEVNPIDSVRVLAELFGEDLVKDPIQDAVVHLTWWMPLDASAERCSVFDIAYILVSKDDPALAPKIALVREALVTEANHGSRLAHDALCYAATVLIKRGKDLPPWLGRYFVSVAAEDKVPSRRGRKPQTNSLRDTAIAWTVGKIAMSYGLKPTRSPATKEKGTIESGCSVVQKALAGLGIDMKEENVNAIWRHAGPHDDTRSALMEAAMASNALRRDFWRLFASRRAIAFDRAYVAGNHGPSLRV